MISERIVLEYGQLIINFLISCGGNYKDGLSKISTYAVFHSLGTGQYLIKADESGIRYFICYWRIKPEDVEGIKERVLPIDLTTGSVMYVCDAAWKYKEDLLEIRKRLRQAAVGIQGIIWHRPTKSDKVYHFLHQRGMEV